MSAVVHHRQIYDEEEIIGDGTMVVINKTPMPSNMAHSDCLSLPSTTTCTTDDCWDAPLFFDSDDAFLVPVTSEEAGDAESGVFIGSSPPSNCSCHEAVSTENDCCRGGHEPIFITNSDTSTIAFAPCGSCPRRTMSCGSKKNVRFADAQGKPLASVVTFANSPIGSYDSNSNTPIIATPLARIFSMIQTAPTKLSLFDTNSCMELLFPDPLTSYSVLADKLRTQNVALESVCSRSGFVKGAVRVRNLTYSKNVFVRMTFDAWSSSHDWPCDIYPIVAQIDGDCNDYDLFEFAVPIPPHLTPGTIVQFCICFQCDQGEFWDNNFSQNYSLRYCPPTVPQTVVTNNNSLASLKGADTTEAERARRIREFVWSEFACWNGNTNNSNATVVAQLPNVRHHVVVAPLPPLNGVNTPKTTAPPTSTSPYW